MFFKIIAFVAAAIPIFLFVRSIFSRRTTRINEGLRELGAGATNDFTKVRSIQAHSGL
jgi:hypothetical protein